MYSNRGDIKTFVSLIIAFLIFHSEGLGQYTKVPRPSTTISPNCGGYYEFLPPDYSTDKSKPHPLIITLHGTGEGPVNGVYDLNKLVDPNAGSWYWSLAHRINNDPGFPSIFLAGGQPYPYGFVVMAPQCGYFASPDDLEAYLNYFTTNYNIDPDRIFLTGYSHGATKTWAAMSNGPLASRFAAIVPISGGAEGNYLYCPTSPTPCANGSDGSDFNKVVTHLADFGAPKVFSIMGATEDIAVNLIYNQDYVSQINLLRLAANARYYAYPGQGHIGAWNLAHDPGRGDFDGRNMYTWMLEQAAALILPVTLTSFDARAVSKEVVLNWSTASESNSSHFSVERSSNGKDFKDIGRVNSHGNSSTPKNYSFTDNAPLSGNSYYRLKMIDRDASFKYSDVRKVSLNGSDLEFSFGPNPVSNEAWIKITGTQKVAMQITITDLMGRTLKTMNVAKTGNDFSQRIDMGGLKAGQYILAIRGENINYTQRLIKR